jgi:dTDP-4-dehydrorhamnose reductase
MQRMLITGGAGYLGAELVAQAAGCFDLAATYFTQHPAIGGVQWRQLDIRDGAAAMRVFGELQPEIVIHTAYRQSGPDLWATTATGTEQIVQAARAHGARLVHVSSDALFDGELPVGRSYTEADDPSPITPYGEAKAAAERLVEQHMPAALVVRTSLIYGGIQPGQHEQFVIGVLNGRADVTFFTDELRCPIAVRDLAAALLELAAGDRCGRLHVAGPEVLSRFEFARMIATAYGYDPAQLRAGLSVASAARRPRNCALDCSAAYAMLHTRIRSIGEVFTR